MGKKSFVIIAQAVNFLLFFIADTFFIENIFARLALAIVYLAVSVIVSEVFMHNVGKNLSTLKEVLQSIFSEGLSSQKRTEETKQEIEEIDAIFETQVEKMEEISRFMSEMSISSQQTSSVATEASKKATETNMAAQEGGQVSEQSLEKLTTISDIVTNSTAMIKNLSGKSEEIINVVKVIDDISRQTNLLALNASIEAERAGEAGRGFSVVAEEIRKLAEISAESTKHISEIVSTIQGYINDCVEAMEGGAQEVDKSSEVIKKSLVSLQQIASSAEDVTSKIEEISNSANQQYTEILSVSGSIEQAVGSARETDERMHAIEEKIDEQLERITEVRSKINGLEEQYGKVMKGFGIKDGFLEEMEEELRESEEGTAESESQEQELNEETEEDKTEIVSKEILGKKEETKSEPKITKKIVIKSVSDKKEKAKK